MRKDRKSKRHQIKVYNDRIRAIHKTKQIFQKFSHGDEDEVMEEDEITATEDEDGEESPGAEANADGAADLEVQMSQMDASRQILNKSGLIEPKSPMVHRLFAGEGHLNPMATVANSTVYSTFYKNREPASYKARRTRDNFYLTQRSLNY